jgi:hypothetical protein
MLFVTVGVPLIGDTWLLRFRLKRLGTSSLATGPQRREISPVDMRLVELRATDSLELNRRAFPENHGLNR